MLLIVVVVMLFIIVCYCKLKGKRRKFDINSQEEPSSSYSSSKGSLNNPELATPDLCRKASVMEMKQLDLSGLISSEDEDLIPSGAIPVDMFSEHMEKFNENCRLLFQREFDVSDVIIMSWSVSLCITYMYAVVHSGSRSTPPTPLRRPATSTLMMTRTDTVTLSPVS